MAWIAALLILIILSAAGWYIGHHRNGSPKATQTKKGVIHQPMGDGRDKARPAPIASGFRKPKLRTLNLAAGAARLLVFEQDHRHEIT